MKRKRKFYIGLTVLLISTVVLILKAENYNFIFDTKPRKPKQQIPITYNLGWWSYQNQMAVDNFKVDIIESKLNLFNSETLLSYTISGQLKYEGHWKPYIKEVHISERQLHQDSLHTIDAEIQITPIIGVKEEKAANEGTVAFNFTNEHIVTSMHWGTNKISFICEQFEKVVEVTQKK